MLRYITSFTNQQHSWKGKIMSNKKVASKIDPTTQRMIDKGIVVIDKKGVVRLTQKGWKLNRIEVMEV